MSAAPVTTAPLLVELFTEELPPKVLQRLSDAFAGGIFDGLQAQGLLAPGASIEKFSTPRRLAVRISAVLAAGAARQQSKKLMPVKVGLDADGKAMPALLKRLDKEGAGMAHTQRRVEGDAEYVFLEQTLAGVPLAAALQTALADAIAKLPTPKRMSYQLADGETTVQFVRPAHGLVALHGDQLVEVSALGLHAGRLTHGHRFQGVKDIPLASAITYEGELATHGKVVASFELRRAEITTQLNETAAGLHLSLGPQADVLTLLDEVTALVENPAVYAGAFDAEFLSVPQECLILTMRANQKYFPLFDGGGKLANKFLIVSNMRVSDPRHIIEGNQRVVRPRLADAQFFFETDKKIKLAERVPQLAKVTYQQKLGSVYERVQRVDTLSRLIAGTLHRAGFAAASEADAGRAAYLSKADLLSNMVGEFPELQGLMGRYYAEHDGEKPEVSRAIEEHYRPRFAGDALPETLTGTVVALADKLDALSGIFGIGLLPSGDKDPFALRRAALGVLRMLVEKRLPLDTQFLLDAAANGLQGKINPGTQDLVHEFLLDRLRGYLREQGYEANEIEAVLARAPARLNHEVLDKLRAVRNFQALPEAASLAAANKRIGNILKQSDLQQQLDRKLFAEAAEKQLSDAIAAVKPGAVEKFSKQDYTGMLQSLAALRAPVDTFFEQVMVMAEDPVLRGNRIALLRELHGLMNQVADLSKLAG